LRRARFGARLFQFAGAPIQNCSHANAKRVRMLENSVASADGRADQFFIISERNHPMLTPIQITRQLAVFLDNRPGTLARVCDALKEAKISIYAITTSDTVDHSVIRMVVSDTSKALKIFEEHGSLVVDDEVLMVSGENKLGALAGIAHKLADAGVNIEYAYCATHPDERRGLLILRVSNAAKALKVLNAGLGRKAGEGKKAVSKEPRSPADEG